MPKERSGGKGNNICIREASSTSRIWTTPNGSNSSTGGQHAYKLVDHVGNGGGAVYDVIGKLP